MKKWLKILIASVGFWTPVGAAFNITASNLGGDNTSFISISGKTNVNTFSFRQDFAFLTFGSSPLGKPFVRITIPVKYFETSNPAMYADFVALLKVSEHPNIFIDLLTADFYALQQGRTVEQSVKVYLTIAGVIRFYDVNLQIATFSNDCFSLKGEREIRLLDFGIAPPQKFFGMVKVRDEVHIDFRFSLCIKKGTIGTPPQTVRKIRFDRVFGNCQLL